MYGHVTPAQGIPHSRILNPELLDMETMGCPTCNKVLDNACRCPHCDEDQCYACIKEGITK